MEICNFDIEYFLVEFNIQFIFSHRLTGFFIDTEEESVEVGLREKIHFFEIFYFIFSSVFNYFSYSGNLGDIVVRDVIKLFQDIMYEVF